MVELHHSKPQTVRPSFSDCTLWRTVVLSLCQIFVVRNSSMTIVFLSPHPSEPRTLYLVSGDIIQIIQTTSKTYVCICRLFKLPFK